MYDLTPALMQAMCIELGFRLPRPCLVEPSELDSFLAKQAARNIEVYPDIVTEASAAAPAEAETSSMRKDAPVFVPLPAAVAAGEETSPDEEVLVLQQPQPQPEEEETSPDEEVLVVEQPMSKLNISEPPVSQEDCCPSENEGEGSPRIQPSVVPEEFLADLEDIEGCEPSQQEQVLPKVKAKDDAAGAQDSKKTKTRSLRSTKDE